MVSLSDQMSATPTALGISARLALRLLEARGIDPAPCLLRSHLSIEDLDGRKRISAIAQIDFLNEIATATDDDFIGLTLAESYDLRELGLIYYVAASSSSLHEAFERLARYSKLGNEGIFGREKRGAPCTVEFVFEGVQRHRDRQQVEFLAVTLVRLCRQILGRNVVPESTSFIHFRSDDEKFRYSLLGREVQFGALGDEMTFDPSLFDSPLIGQDPYLSELMAQACDEALARRKAAGGTFRTMVENAIAPLLPHGEANLKRVSRQLGVSERTFHRRLVKEGLSFSAILDDMRRDLAEEYLTDADLQVSQIAWLLGFRSPSAFTHSCRRWFGKSPTHYRRTLQQPPSVGGRLSH